MMLLKCPFCGCGARVVRERVQLRTGYDIRYHVECVGRRCSVRTLSWYPRTAAVESWQRRAKLAEAGHAAKAELEAVKAKNKILEASF